MMQKNSINQIDFQLINLNKQSTKPFFYKNSENENTREFKTMNWVGDNKAEITQKFTQVREDYAMYNFTNQEALADKNAAYNLGEGRNYINKGDIGLDFNITNFNFVNNTYFEMAINVNFLDDSNRNKINNGLFLTYASLSSDNKNDTAKIVSVKINNVETNTGNSGANNFIVIRTTKFLGNACVKFLFKYWDSKKFSVMELQGSTNTTEKLTLKNAGGQFIFVDANFTEAKGLSNLDDFKRKSIRLTEIKETVGAKKTVIRSYDTKELYSEFTTSQDKKNVTADTLFITDKAQAQIIVRTADLDKNATRINHMV